MINVYRKIAEKPYLVLVVLILFGAVFTGSIKKNARIETDLDKYMPQDNPEFVASDMAEEEFEIRDSVIIAIEHPETVYNPETLAKIRTISEILPERFDRIKEEDISSLFTAENITADEWGLVVEPFYGRRNIMPEQADQIRRAVQGNEMVDGRLVSKDGRAALVILDMADEDFSLSFYEELLSFAQEYEGPENIRITGRPIIEGEMTKLGPKDMARMAPLVLILIILIVFLLLRSARDTLINVVIVLIGTLSAFGMMTLFKIPIYSVSTMIPVMLIAIGVADGIHLHNAIAFIVRENPDISRNELIQETLRSMSRPVQMTSITTAIGFLSLLTSDVLPVRYFGLFTAVGIMVEMLLALILFPASIHLFGVPGRNRKRQSPETKKTVRAQGTFSARYSRKLLSRPGRTLFFTILVLAAAVWGTTLVWIDTSFLANFQKDSAIVETDTFVNTHFGGTSTLNIVFRAAENDVFKNPEVLEVMDDIQKKVEMNPLVGDSFALTDYLKRMHQVMHADDSEYNRIPESRDLIAQYLLLYEMSGDPDNLNQVVDYDYANANMTFQLKSDSSALMMEVMKEIDPFLPALAAEGVSVQYAGSGYKSMIFAELLMKGQIASLLFSFILVALMLTLMFKSILTGLAGTIPISVTAVINFGLMGLLGIPLSSSTAIISAIAIGIGVDYAIHLIEQYRTNREKGFGYNQAAEKTLAHTGRAIVYNAIAVIGGFSVLLVSVFPPNRQVGGLVGLNMATSMAGTLTLLILALVKIDRRKNKVINNIEGDRV